MRRRGMDWEGSVTLPQTIGANSIGTHYIVTPSTVSEEFTDPTLTRSRLQLTIENAAGYGMGAYGIIAWPDKNDTSPGALEAPDPFLNPSMDWVMHGYFLIPSGTNLIYPGGGSEGALESKAQRKLGNMYGILFVISTHASSASVVYATGARCLIKDG